MRKIGKQVLMIEAKEGNPRNSEGAFIRLSEGGIMFAYTEYEGGSWQDHAPANISAVFSYDEGETWGDKRILIKKSEDELNIMSVSLVRMKNGDVGMFYVSKYGEENGEKFSRIMLTRSNNEGGNWSAPVSCTTEEGYFVLNNDRVIRLRSGRLIFATARHKLIGHGCGAGSVYVTVSDDDGITWRTIEQVIHSPFGDKVGLQEPGLYQYENGEIIMYIRTNYGCQYKSISSDNGETWTSPEPDIFFTSPCSPMLIKKSNKYTLAIFNPVARYHSPEGLREWSRRTPYVCSVSDCDGTDDNFYETFCLEDDKSNGYCYPAILEGKDYFLTAYCHSNNTDSCLNSIKIVKVLYKEIEQKDNTFIGEGKIF